MTPIRKAEASDLSAIEACARAAYHMYVERIGREPAPMVADFAGLIENEVIYVAEVEDKLCGFVVFYPREQRVHLENVAVSPDFQGQGYGAILIDFAEQQARAAGFGEIELYTNARMTENLGLYPRLGYQQFDRRIEDGFDRVYFKKTL